ncbi:MAG: HTH domain-containing protein [Clostridia bacterium]|nr:HTH domain-containing protein [Clostridia bacterium]
MRPNERREAILKALCRRRQDTIVNLANEFGVSIRTIKYDIDELTLSHPIETIRGRYGGGVKVADGYYIGRKYLKPRQRELLLRVQTELSDEDAILMQSILDDFTL